MAAVSNLLENIETNQKKNNSKNTKKQNIKDKLSTDQEKISNWKDNTETSKLFGYSINYERPETNDSESSKNYENFFAD